VYTDLYTLLFFSSFVKLSLKYIKGRNRQTDRERETDRKKKKQTVRQRDRWRDGEREGEGGL